MIDPLLNKLFGLTRPQKRFLQVALDCALIVSSFGMAMALRYDNLHFLFNPMAWIVLLVVTPITIAAFIKLGLYRAVVRYITAKAMQHVMMGVVLSAAVMQLSVSLFALPVPRSVPTIYALLALISIGGTRFLLRGIYNRRKWMRLHRNSNVIIFGAGNSGRQLLNVIKQGLDYAPVGFVDDAPELHGTEVGGLQVFPPEQLESLIRDNDVRSVLLAVPSATRAERRAIIARLEPFAVEVRTIPGMADILSGKASFSDLRVVSVEELLGRDPIPPRADLLARNIAGKSVLVSGAGGSIGSELCRQILLQRPRRLVLLDVSEFALYKIEGELRAEAAGAGADACEIVPILGSVQNPGRMEMVLRVFGIDTVYHAAAYKHVPMVELNVVEGIRNNVFGTQTLAQAAVAAGVESFILISTDKAVRPTNFMGTSKRMAELICQALAETQDSTRFSMVRFGNVLGSSGSVIPHFAVQIEAGGPLTVTHPEITRYFMTIPEAAQLVLQAGAMAQGGEVFVLDMGEPVKIVDLAQHMVGLYGLTPYIEGQGAGDIAITFTGLRPGEKLYEELLIGDNPAATEHPRIMCATESCLPLKTLETLLEDLLEACKAYDLPRIREILRDEAPTGYAPSDPVADQVWHGLQQQDTAFH